jgi:hypothetical protein
MDDGAAPPDPEISAGLKLSVYAAAKTYIALGVPLADALEAAGLSMRGWAETDRAVTSVLLSTKDRALLQAYDRHRAAAEENIVREVAPLDRDVTAWLDFFRTFSAQPDPTAYLESLGLDETDLFRLMGLWQERMATDPAVRRAASDAMAVDPNPIPPLKIGPRRLVGSKSAHVVVVQDAPSEETARIVRGALDQERPPTLPFRRVVEPARPAPSPPIQAVAPPMVYPVAPPAPPPAPVAPPPVMQRQQTVVVPQTASAPPAPVTPYVAPPPPAPPPAMQRQQTVVDPPIEKTAPPVSSPVRDLPFPPARKMNLAPPTPPMAQPISKVAPALDLPPPAPKENLGATAPPGGYIAPAIPFTKVAPQAPPAPPSQPVAPPPTKAQPPIPPPTGSAPAANAPRPRLALPAYAALCAELAERPDAGDEVLARFHFSSADKWTEDAAWKAEMARDPRLYETLLQLIERARVRLRSR